MFGKQGVTLWDGTANFALRTLLNVVMSTASASTAIQEIVLISA